jgi:hypothetical protein
MQYTVLLCCKVNDTFGILFYTFIRLFAIYAVIYGYFIISLYMLKINSNPKL